MPSHGEILIVKDTAVNRKWRFPPLLWLAGLLLLAFVVLNAAAYMQARAMTHYRPATEKSTRMAALTSPWERAKIFFTGPTVRRQSNTRTPADLGWEFQTAHFRGSHGLQLEAWQVPGAPGSPVVMLFPPYGGSKDVLLHAAREFREMGCELWMTDFHGIGGSQGTVTSIGYHEAEDVAAAVQYARANGAEGRRLILYGPSMGAVAIMRAVAKYGVTADGLILECPFDRLVNTIGTRMQILHLPEFPFAHLVTFWAGVQQRFDGFAHNPIDYAGKIECAVLLLQGTEDESVGPMHIRNVANRLSGKATARFIPEAGHAFLVLRAREPWLAAVTEFLRGEEDSPQHLGSEN